MSLQFMMDCEASRGGINARFWEVWQWADGERFFYSPFLGELRLEHDMAPITRGGLLCDEMGMGKTVVVAARIIADKMAGHPPPLPCSLKSAANSRPPVAKGKPKSAAEAAAAADPPLPVPKTNGTLIVAPVTLIRQWANELDKCIAPGLLTVQTFLADDILKLRKHLKKSVAAKNERKLLVEQLREADVVLTSYKALGMDNGNNSVLHNLCWRRICLDEMQEIRSSTTKLAQACARLNSDFRWMISGTPLYTSIDDLHGELAFLKVVPFCLSDDKDGFWKRKIGLPCELQDQQAIVLLRHLLKRIMVRHSKSQTTLAGQPILQLPKADTEYRMVTPTAAERAVVTFLEGLVHTFDRRKHLTIESGAQVIKDQNRRSDMLLRFMRGVCTSMHLLNGGVGCGHDLKALNGIVRDLLGTGGAAQDELRVTSSRMRKLSPRVRTSPSCRPRACRHLPVRTRPRPTSTRTLSATATTGVGSTTRIGCLRSSRSRTAWRRRMNVKRP